MNAAAPLLAIDDVSVSYRHAGGWSKTVHSVSLEVAAGETFGLAGESGSGKSTLIYQTLGYRPANARLDSGHVRFKGSDVLAMNDRELRRLRGNRISLVPQNPTTALSPGMRVGEQIAEVLVAHGIAGSAAANDARIAELFGLVGLPNPAEIGQRYPHQLSGGQQQRVAIAMAIACKPDLLVLDEPTTGLDVTTQKQILDLLRSLRDRFGMAMLYVTHDLGVLAEIADRVGVMYAGYLVEVAPTATFFSQPRHPYTRSLIASRPQIEDAGRPQAQALRGLLRRSELPPGCAFAPRCDHAEPSCFTNRQVIDHVTPDHLIACQRWRAIAAPTLAAEYVGVAEEPQDTREHLLELDHVAIAYGGRGGLKLFRQKSVTIVDDLSIAIDRGETLALVGESGSGKSTIARAVAGLVPPSAGAISFAGDRLTATVRQRPAGVRRQIQYIFQNPDASLNPRMTVGGILARPLHVFFGLDARATDKRIIQALDDVRLDQSYMGRYPDELSGGERQRVAIARAIIAEPVLLLCDEVLSALDVSVQANVIALLQRLRREHDLSMLFISHDLAVVRSLADRVAVLFRGTVVELGDVESVFAPPFHPYTYALLRAVPGAVAAGAPVARASGEARTSPKGCTFAGRCPWQLGEVCERETPPVRVSDRGLQIRCHIPLDELSALTDWPAFPEIRAAEVSVVEIDVVVRQ